MEDAEEGTETAAAYGLPALPGFREMALRRMAAERAELVRELVGQRQAAGLSQTEVAARMGTSQSAVARLEAGTTDVRTSTLERYAAAVGGRDHLEAEWLSSSAGRADRRSRESSRARESSRRRASRALPAVLGCPGSPDCPPGEPGPVPGTRVWMDPHADWQDRLYDRLLGEADRHGHRHAGRRRRDPAVGAVPHPRRRGRRADPAGAAEPALPTCPPPWR